VGSHELGGIEMMVSKSLAGAAVVLLCAGPALANQDVESDLAAMQEQMKVLQQQVEAQQEQLEQQGEQLEEAQNVVRRTQEDTKAVSGLAKFLETVEIDGSVAGSYFYNFNNPDSSYTAGGGAVPPAGPPAGVGGNQGFNGAFYPFTPDHNSFQVDQVWFGLAKSATEEGRAGFGFDMLFGQRAASMNSLYGGSTQRNGGDSTSDLYVHQAYVEYLAPVGDGLNVKAGKFATLVGAEVLDTTKNFNITNGSVYNLFQPIDHTGLLLTQSLGAAEVAVGVVNTGNLLGGSSPDTNKAKAVIVSTAMTQDKMSGRATLVYGADRFNDNSNKDGLFDVVATFDPSDTLSLWFNGDYAWEKGSGRSGWGLAAAGRQALGDKTGISVRAEYANEQGLNESFFGLGDGSCQGGTACLAELWGLTGTVDHELVENLVLRGEVRYDQVNIRGTDEFIDGRATTNEVGTGNTSRKSQITVGAQIAYIF
jgi:hypothetical protein